MSVKKPRIELLCFGSELLRDKVNTNVNSIAEKLFSVGLALDRATTVADETDEAELSLREALRRSDVLLTCGGLGPTFDDLTRECVSKVLKKPLRFSRRIFLRIKRKFDSLGLRMPQENERQAYLIGNAKPILNKTGTAPGQIIHTKSKCIILLPGPPHELIPMLEEVVCPHLKKKYGQRIVRGLTLHVFAHSESEIDERIQPVVEKDWDGKSVNAIFGILAHHSIIDVKATVAGKRMSEVQAALSRIKAGLYKVLGADIYGRDGETLESVVGKILKKRRETLSVAESCTGGLLADKLTNVAGSSAYFKEGVVAYSNEGKRRLLGVRLRTLKKFGAVSIATAEEMAKGILKKSGSDWAVSVTGIVGPSGGTAMKPVGLVCFAVANQKRLFSFSCTFSGSRLGIKEKSALMALDILRKKLCRLLPQ